MDSVLTFRTRDSKSKPMTQTIRAASLGEQDHPVMNVSEVADYLRIPLSSIYKLAREGRIPCQKVGRQWRFHRSAIDQWLTRISADTREGDSQATELRSS
jgi:excisionase family DNA binding protein